MLCVICGDRARLGGQVCSGCQEAMELVKELRLRASSEVGIVSQEELVSILLDIISRG